MNKHAPICVISFALLLPLLPLQAADMKALERELDLNPMEACEEVIEYYRGGNLDAALASGEVCVSEMKEMKQHVAAGAFPDDIEGFAGGETRQQNTMGFTQIERSYVKEGEGTINVSHTGGGMANMMQMAINVSGRKSRFGQHSGHIIDQGGERTIYVPVGDSALMFQSRDVAINVMKRFAKAFLKAFSG